MSPAAFLGLVFALVAISPAASVTIVGNPEKRKENRKNKREDRKEHTKASLDTPRGWDGSEVEGIFDDAASILKDKKKMKNMEPMDDAELMKLKCDAETKDVLRNVHVFGLQNTGTDLLDDMLAWNFQGSLRRYAQKHEVNATTNETRYTRCGNHLGHGIWKHSHLAMVHRKAPEAIEELRKQRVVALIMIRNPLSWFQSMRKAPYELEPCVQNKDWLTSSCYHKHPAGGYLPIDAKNFSGLIGVWNAWNRAFDEAVDNGFDEAIVLRYEDLVLYPEETMELISKYLGVKMPVRKWEIIEDAAKTHGDAHGRQEAIKRIKEHSYNRMYNEDGIEHEAQTICKNIDTDVLHRYYAKVCPNRHTKAK